MLPGDGRRSRESESHGRDKVVFPPNMKTGGARVSVIRRDGSDVPGRDGVLFPQNPPFLIQRDG